MWLSFNVFDVVLWFVQAYHGHCGALEVLLSSLLDVDVRSPDGRTPLSLACSRGHQECASLLLHHSASPMARDYIHKKTALHAAGRNAETWPTTGNFMNAQTCFTCAYLCLLLQL